MVIHTCLRCLKKFTKKYAYDVHVNRKFKCKENILHQIAPEVHQIAPNSTKPVQETPKKYECKYCNQQFTRNSSLIRHQQRKVCSQKLNIEEENEKLREENKLLHEKLEEFGEKLEQIEKSVIEKQPSSVMNNSHNNSHNNVNIFVNFGHEEINRLTPPEIFKIATSKYGAIRNYVEYTHLNDRLPDQQNIKITNMRSNDCQIIENNKWVTRDVNEVINELISNGVNNIEGYLEEHDINLTKDQKEKLLDLLEKIQNCQDPTYPDHEKDTKLMNKVKREIKRLIYDSKKFV